MAVVYRGEPSLSASAQDDVAGDATLTSACAPFEPIKKAIGGLVGVGRFVSAKQQIAMLGNTGALSETMGLTLLFGGGDGDEGGGSEAPVDPAVLAEYASIRYFDL